MTNREIISRIRSEHKLSNSDNRISNRFIFNLLVSKVKYLIKREFEKLKYWRGNESFQTLSCVELQEVDASTCKDICSCKTLYRSTCQIPELLDTQYGKLIQRVSSIELGNSRTFTQVTENQYDYRKNKKYNIDNYYFIKDGYIYIPDYKIERIRISAYFFEDISNINYCDCSTQSCRLKLNENFICPSYLIEELIDLVNRELLNVYHRFIEDNKIDKNTNTK